jgi:hypothetical protein
VAHHRHVLGVQLAVQRTLCACALGVEPVEPLYELGSVGCAPVGEHHEAVRGQVSQQHFVVGRHRQRARPEHAQWVPLAVRAPAGRAHERVGATRAGGFVDLYVVRARRVHAVHGQEPGRHRDGRVVDRACGGSIEGAVRLAGGARRIGRWRGVGGARPRPTRRRLASHSPPRRRALPPAISRSRGRMRPARPRATPRSWCWSVCASPPSPSLRTFTRANAAPQRGSYDTRGESVAELSPCDGHLEPGCADRGA